MFHKFYYEIKAAFDAAENEGILYRKVAKIPGWHVALLSEVFVYEKARLDLIKIGDQSMVPGKMVIDLVRAPHSLDGFVICC